MIFFPLSCSLDPEQKDQLVEVIEKLLKDQTTVRHFLLLDRVLNHSTSFPPHSWWQGVL
jgi:hypothetical protein